MEGSGVLVMGEGRGGNESKGQQPGRLRSQKRRPLWDEETAGGKKVCQANGVTTKGLGPQIMPTNRSRDSPEEMKIHL